MISDRDDRKISLNSSLVPPQLPPFLASVFKLKPILGHPSREEVKLVHEAIRALNNFMHSQYIHFTCHLTPLNGRHWKCPT
jgi:hypothetical protein